MFDWKSFYGFRIFRNAKTSILLHFQKLKCWLYRCYTHEKSNFFWRKELAIHFFVFRKRPFCIKLCQDGLQKGLVFIDGRVHSCGCYHANQFSKRNGTKRNISNSLRENIILFLFVSNDKVGYLYWEDVVGMHIDNLNN